MQRQPTPEEQDSLYRAICLGIWHLQYLEFALHTLLTIKIDIRAPGNVAARTANASLEKRKRQTLGSALRNARENNALSANLQTRLEAFLVERNWLVHQSIDEHAEGMYNDQGRTRALARLAEFTTVAKSLRDSLFQDIAAYAQAHGVPIDEAAQRAHLAAAQLRGEA